MNKFLDYFFSLHLQHDANLYLTDHHQNGVRERVVSSSSAAEVEKWKDVLVLSESFIKFFTINFKKSGKKLIATSFLTQQHIKKRTCVHRECAYSPSCQIKNLNSFLISLWVEYSIYFSLAPWHFMNITISYNYSSVRAECVRHRYIGTVIMTHLRRWVSLKLAVYW